MVVSMLLLLNQYLISFFQSNSESFRGKWEDGFWYKGKIEEVCGTGKC